MPEDAGGGVEQGLVGGLRRTGDENGAGVTAPEEGDHVGQDLVEVGFAAILDVAGEGLADDRVGLKNVPAHGLEGIGLCGGSCGGRADRPSAKQGREKLDPHLLKIAGAGRRATTNPRLLGAGAGFS